MSRSVQTRQLSHSILSGAMATFDAQIRMMFGQRATDELGPTTRRYIKLRRDGNDTVAEVKDKVAVICLPVFADQLL